MLFQAKISIAEFNEFFRLVIGSYCPEICFTFSNAKDYQPWMIKCYTKIFEKRSILQSFFFKLWIIYKFYFTCNSHHFPWCFIWLPETCLYFWVCLKLPVHVSHSCSLEVKSAFIGKPKPQCPNSRLVSFYCSKIANRCFVCKFYAIFKPEFLIY